MRRIGLVSSRAALQDDAGWYAHRMGVRDTTPEAAAVQTAVHRRLGGGGRFRLAAEISDLFRRWVRPVPLVGGQTVTTAPAGAAMPPKSEKHMSVENVFARVRAALLAAGVPHMLTGSFASSFHGTPRATQDIDIVIAPDREQLLALIDQFPESMYYVDRDAALDALARHSQFTVIDLATGWKIDFIIRKPRAFSREEFARRRPADLSGVEMDIASAEDILLAKLEWAKQGGSARQIEDAAGIIRLQGERLDTAYLQRWATALRLHEQWQAALQASK
jgi:hypothetical protein